MKTGEGLTGDTSVTASVEGDCKICVQHKVNVIVTINHIKYLTLLKKDIFIHKIIFIGLKTEVYFYFYKVGVGSFSFQFINIWYDGTTLQING